MEREREGPQSPHFGERKVLFRGRAAVGCDSVTNRASEGSEQGRAKEGLKLQSEPPLLLRPCRGFWLL